MVKKNSENLLELGVRIQKGKKVDKIINSLENELSALEERSSILQSTLKKEVLEYESIIAPNIYTLVYAILGNLDQKIEREQKEAIIAKLRYDECQLEIANVQQRICELEKERNSSKQLIKEYVMLYNERLKLLLGGRSKSAGEIRSLNGKIGKLQMYIFEIDEAISVGSRIIENLEKIIKFIVSAEGWRVNSLYLSKRISKAKMDSEIKVASENIRDVVHLFRVLKTELMDVINEMEMDQEIIKLTELSEVFFSSLTDIPYAIGEVDIENDYVNPSILVGDTSSADKIAYFLSDEIVEQGILNYARPSMLIRLNETKNQVQNILDTLSRLEKEKSTLLEKLHIKMNDLITKS